MKKSTPSWSISGAMTGELRDWLRLEALDNGFWVVWAAMSIEGLKLADGNGVGKDGQCNGSMSSYAALATGDGIWTAAEFGQA